MRHDACGICFSKVNPVLDGRQIRFVGSSGSSIADMRSMLVLVEPRERLPQVYAKLGPGEAWTVAAEEELLRLLLR